MMKSKSLFACAACAVLAACQSSMHPHAQMMAQGQKMGFSGFNNVPEFNSGDVYPAPAIMELKAIQSLDVIMPKLLEKRVIFVGEVHDRLDHHLNQLEIIRRLHETDEELAIGMEFFQQPFQQYLDAFIAGKIDEKEFLKKSEYFQRWRVDYRHYQPIIRYAKEHGIALLALDVSEEVRQKIGRGNTDALSEQERAQIPKDIDRSNQDYRELLQSIYAIHPDSGGSFERFMEVQLTRDEAMAEIAAGYLQKHPKSRMVILAGGGHMIYGYGIPSRLKRRMDVPMTVVLNDSLKQVDAEVADYLLMPLPLRLPGEARMGIVMETPDAGTVHVGSLVDNSPAQQVGMEKGDRLLSVDGQDITSMADVKIALLEKKPGDKAQVKVQRKNWLGAQQELGFELVLY